jgi:LruC domain-containing protein
MNYPHTNRANPFLFGTEDDDTIPAQNEFYLSTSNLPWGLLFLESWHYPAEKNSIIEVYYNFAAWAESGGTLFNNWYLFNGSQVDLDKVYLEP